MQLCDELKQQVKMLRGIGAPPGAWIMQEFVIRNGIERAGILLHPDYIQGIPKYCFMNSARLVNRFHRRQLTYVEGYAYNTKINWAFHHAWVVDKDNNVIEATLREPENYQYMGVKIPRDEYKTETRNTHSASVLSTYGPLNIKYMLKKDPTLAELIPEYMDRFLG